MIKTYIKCQFRMGLFFLPVLLIPLILTKINYLILFLFLQKRFYNVFFQEDFQLTLLFITGARLNKILRSFNLSWAIWFNLWFIIAQIIDSLYFKTEFSLLFIKLINFNTILFTSFIIGNIISNSNISIIKNYLIKLLIPSFIFSLGIGFFYLLLRLSAILNITPFANLILLTVAMSTWFYNLKKQNSIKNIHYYL